MNEWSQSKPDKVSTTWTALTEMYGNRFTREYGDLAPDTWRAAINSLRDYELSRGLRNLLSAGSGSPPTLPQFSKACRQVDETGGMERNHSPMALPNPEHEEPVWVHAQRCMFAYIWDRDGVSGELLPAMIAEKNKLVHSFKSILADDSTLTGADIRDALFKAWDRIVAAHVTGQAA